VAPSGLPGIKCNTDGLNVPIHLVVFLEITEITFFWLFCF